jgi:hypothetical protein
MGLIVLVIALAAFVVYLGALFRMVRNNRPATPPRSHLHELDPAAARLRFHLVA